MKRIYAVWLFVGLCCLAIDFPPVRNPNLVFIHILPEETGKEVVLEFDKRDVNGYVGTDAIVLTVISPSGKNVCEIAMPDDGNEKNDWQPGPRQRVVLRFNADEEGEYVVNSNSFSSVDISYAFDQATSKNATWGLTLKRPRLLHGKLHLFMVAAPRAIGERQELVMLVENAKWTSIADFQCLEDGAPLMEPYTHRTKTEKRLDDLRFPLSRNSREGIVEIKASDFAECSWRFVGYSDFILCADLHSAQRFRTFHNHQFFSGSHVEFKTPQTAGRFAFAPKGAYRVTFLPEKGNDAFQFAAYVLGEKHDIAPGTESFEFTMPEGTPYIEWNWSAAPEGRVLVQTVTAEPEILQPESGSVWSLKTPPLLWTPAAGATAYTVTMTHQESGKLLSLSAKGNSLGWDAFVSRLSPGIWKWQVSVEGKSVSPERAAFFAIPQRGDTSLAYLWGQQPAMDSLVDGMPSQLSCRILGKSLDDIDWKATVWSVNGKSLAARPADSSRIEAVVEPGCFLNGRNNVTLRVTDRHGNFQLSSWGFDVTTAVPRVLSHDAQGRIQMNGRFFYPIIYYGYLSKKLKLEEIGFNTHLTNGFSNQAQLDDYLLRNLKLIDAGGSFKESPLETVRQFAASPLARHSARIGMWCDELDVHRPLEWIRDYLAIFSKNDAWRGVCSCNLSLYGKMAEYGDYLMVDSYVYDSARLFRIDNAFAMARTAAGGKPLLALLCGFSNEDPKLVPFMPTVKDVEYQLYAALRHGVNGIGLYQCGPYRMEAVPELWGQATEMLRRFSAISFIVAGEDATNAVRVTASEGAPSYRAFRIENRLFLVLQNSSFTPGVFQVTLPASADTPVKVLQENRVIRMKQGVFSDVFQGAATHCYALDIR